MYSFSTLCLCFWRFLVRYEEAGSKCREFAERGGEEDEEGEGEE